MLVYAGIDEAGYGPLFGPLLVGRSVIAIDPPTNTPNTPGPADPTPDLWQLLAKAVCRKPKDRLGRIAINDSKKLHTSAAGIRHLELGVLTTAALAGHHPATLNDWLNCLGETGHHKLDDLPWYRPTPDHPWDNLPTTTTAGQLAVARNLLTTATDPTGVRVLDLGASVIFEDRFNRMVAATRSKASACFTFVSAHLRSIWDDHGHHHPTVVVDRQSGRTRYRELLALTFDHAQLTVLEESPQRSAYHIEQTTDRPRTMTISFEVSADDRHMPVALASMVCKYTRELLMARFKTWFTRRAPQIKPTAGYAADAKRFWQQIEPMLPELHIRRDCLLRSR